MSDDTITLLYSAFFASAFVGNLLICLLRAPTADSSDKPSSRRAHKSSIADAATAESAKAPADELKPSESGQKDATNAISFLPWFFATHAQKAAHAASTRGVRVYRR